MDTPQAKFEVGDKVKVISQEKTNERFGIHSDMAGVGDTFFLEDRYYNNYKGLWSYTDVNGFAYDERDLKKFVRPEPEFEVGDKVRVVDLETTTKRHGHTHHMKNVGDEFVITNSTWHDRNESWYYRDEIYRYAPEDLELVREEEFRIKDLPQHVVLRNAKDENDRTFYFGIKRDGWDGTIVVMKYDKGGVLSFVNLFTYSRMFNKTYTVVEEMAVTGLRYVVVGDVPPVGDPLEVRSGGTLRLNHLHEHLPF